MLEKGAAAKQVWTSLRKECQQHMDNKSIPHLFMPPPAKAQRPAIAFAQSSLIMIMARLSVCRLFGLTMRIQHRSPPVGVSDLWWSWGRGGLFLDLVQS